MYNTKYSSLAKDIHFIRFIPIAQETWGVSRYGANQRDWHKNHHCQYVETKDKKPGIFILILHTVKFTGLCAYDSP